MIDLINHYPRHNLLLAVGCLAPHTRNCVLLPRGSPRLPPSFTTDPLDDLLDPSTPTGRQRSREQLGLTVQRGGDRRGDRSAFGPIDCGLAERNHHAMTRNAFVVSIRLQQLEHPT